MVLDEQTGSSYSKGYESLGFAGGLLLDLFLQGKIALAGSNIEVIDSSATGDEFLDSIFEIIKTSDEKRNLMNWIDRLSQKYAYYYLYFDLMEKEGLLKSEISPLLKTKLYYLQKPEIKEQLLGKIHNVVNNSKEASFNIICLLTLLEESNLIKVYMPRDLRKKVKNLLKRILNSDQFDYLSREMILKIKKEIVNVIGARNMFMMDKA